MTASAYNPASIPQVCDLSLKSTAKTPSTLTNQKNSTNFSDVYQKSVKSAKDQTRPDQLSKMPVNTTKEARHSSAHNRNSDSSQDLESPYNGKQLPLAAEPAEESVIPAANISYKILDSNAENNLTTAMNTVYNDSDSNYASNYEQTADQFLTQNSLPFDPTEVSLTITQQQTPGNVDLFEMAPPLAGSSTSNLAGNSVSISPLIDPANSNPGLSSPPSYFNVLQYGQSSTNNLSESSQAGLAVTPNELLSQDKSINSAQELLTQPSSIGLTQKTTSLDIELNQKNNSSSFINTQQLFASLSNASAESTTSLTLFKDQISASQNNAVVPPPLTGSKELASQTLLTQSPPIATESSSNLFGHQDKEFNDTLEGLLNLRFPQNSANEDIDLNELNNGITKSLGQNVASANIGTSAAALTSLPTASINSALGSAAWSQDFNQQVAMFVQQDIKQAHIQLNPQHLGPMEIRISIGAEQQFNVSFNTQHSIVKDALDGAIPKLREMFEQQGLNLGDVNVSQQSHQQKHPNERFHYSENNEEQQQVISLKTLKQGIVDIYA